MRLPTKPRQLPTSTPTLLSGWAGAIEVAITPPAREHGGSGLHADEALCIQIASELRTAMRGRTVVDLARELGVPNERVIEAAALLTARGQVVRRGAKLFVA